MFAAAVILDPTRPIRGLDDSKALPPERREILDRRIRERAVAWAVAGVDAFRIDRINILEASKSALCAAVRKLAVSPDFLFVDALTLDLDVPQRALVGGDARCASIAAASIVAKVARDRTLREWDRVYPGFRFDSNKGYAAPDHYRGLDNAGPTVQHRFSFAPVGQRTLFAAV